MAERRADLDPLTRAVSDTLDELLFRHHGVDTSWSNPEDFLKWLKGRGFEVTPVVEHAHQFIAEPDETMHCYGCGETRPLPATGDPR